MFLTAASELAPGQWVQFALTRNSSHARNLTAGICERHDVRDASLRRPHGAQVLSCRTVVDLLLLASLGLISLSVANSPITGTCCGDGMGHRRLLYVANHAGGKHRSASRAAALC